MAKILIVDDEIGIRELLSEILRDEGHDIQLAENAAAARNLRNAERPDLVLLDIWMPDTDGITLLKEWSVNGQLTMPVVMMSGHGTIDTAVEATRIGAIDYLEKPIALQKLLQTVKRGLQRQSAVVAQAPLSLEAFVRSAPLRELKRRLDQVSQRSRILLLRVGSGNIAELVARTLQAPGASWIDATQPGGPVETGQLQSCAGGVLYVSELSRLARPQQKQLAFCADRLARHDLRLIAVSENNHETLLAEGWDEHLLGRFFEASLPLPSLAELREEVPEIAVQCLLHMVEAGEVPRRKLSTGAQNTLRTRAWPGGFGELRSAVKSLALATLEDEISAEDVHRLLAGPPDPALAFLAFDLPLREARGAFERHYFEHHLRLEGSNMTRLAEKTGMERTHLYRKLKQLGLQAGRRHEEA